MPTYAISGEPVKCACIADNALIEIVGAGTYAAKFKGFMEVVPGEEFVF